MEVFSLLDSSPIVLTYKIIDFKFWETGSYVRMQIVLIDNSVLHVREYNDEFERNYSFHWQDSQGAFLLRWDNAPHHNHLKTFPNHMHKNDLIEESDVISIKEVLKYITSFM
ncbi:MAG: DUF6516 family protein [Desulfotignum sp.]|nr:DUF6516 family protein [Desulfotignum sp.]